MKPALVLLAAGIGSRFGGLKQIEPVGGGGEAIIDFSIFDALRAGFGKTVFVIRHSIEEDFNEYTIKRMEGHIDSCFAFQELDSIPEGFTLPQERKKPWGTGHAMLCAAPCIQENFAVINCDDYYGVSSYKILSDYLQTLDPTIPAGVLIGFTLAKTLSDYGTVSRALCRLDKDGNLSTIEELTKIQKMGDRIIAIQEDGERELQEDDIVSMNMFGFTPAVLPLLQEEFESFLKAELHSEKSEFYIPYGLDKLIQAGKMNMKVLPTEEKWFGITYKEDTALVRNNLSSLSSKGVYPDRLWR